MDDADLIWNRACNIGLDYVPTLPGDRALCDILAFHGLSMNGGIAHAIEVVGPSGTLDAADGYRCLGSAELASLLDHALMLAAPGVHADGQFDMLDLDDETADALKALDKRRPDDMLYDKRGLPK